MITFVLASTLGLGTPATFVLSVAEVLAEGLVLTLVLTVVAGRVLFPMHLDQKADHCLPVSVIGCGAGQP
jgi:hypothetical protein